MFGITYDTWKEICNMYFLLGEKTQKSYLQWFPFSKISDYDKNEIRSEGFFEKYIATGGIVFFPEIMLCSENYIQKGDGSFRNSALISPLLYLVVQSVGMEISKKYSSTRPIDIGVYYAGNLENRRAKYKKDYDDFFKDINASAEGYQYYIKTDITNFFNSINVNVLMERIDSICNCGEDTIPQAQLLLYKELLLYCGDGVFPLIENSIASSYLATVVYLDQIDCKLYDFLRLRVPGIAGFRMIRYVDDLYILFSSDRDTKGLNQIYNAVINEYSSLLKNYGLAINTSKCAWKQTKQINDDLKKSLYDEYVNDIEMDLCAMFTGELESFLEDIYDRIDGTGLTNSAYIDLIEEHFHRDDIEFTATEVFNYLVYDNRSELKSEVVSKTLERIIKRDVSILSIDPKRLSVMVMQAGGDRAIKAMLNQLFHRNRIGVWNSYDTTIAISYLIQSKFQHIELLDVLYEKSQPLYAYYEYNCKTSFVRRTHREKPNRYIRCIGNDKKATFLYFLSLCEKKRSNHLGSYAYYKTFFDRISADMAYQTGGMAKKNGPSYASYYRDKHFKALYSGIENADAIIDQAHFLRNANPLSHSSAGLIDNNSTSQNLENAKRNLDSLIDQYSQMKGI